MLFLPFLNIRDDTLTHRVRVEIVRLEIQIRMGARVCQPFMLNDKSFFIPIDESTLLYRWQCRVNHHENIGMMLVPEIMNARVLLRDVVSVVAGITESLHERCFARRTYTYDCYSHHTHPSKISKAKICNHIISTASHTIRR